MSSHSQLANEWFEEFSPLFPGAGARLRTHIYVVKKLVCLSIIIYDTVHMTDRVTRCGSSATTTRFSSRNSYPVIPWLEEGWLHRLIPYEHMATASPRVGVGMIGQGLLDHHVSLIRDLDRVQNLLRHGRCTGPKTKMATWPMSKQEAMKRQKPLVV